MSRQLTLGRVVASVREYVVLRLDTDDGRSGVAIGYTRATPLLEASRTLCRALDPGVGLAPAAVQADLAMRFSMGWATFVRAASLIDIAIWDIALSDDEARDPETHRWMMVAGYFADSRTTDELVAEAVRFVEDGASIVKVMLHGADHDRDREVVREIRDALGPSVRLGVDLHGSALDLKEAVRKSADFAALGAEFLEDPFPGHPLPLLAQLADVGDLPLAVGEDLVEEWMVGAIADIAGYLRIDATASGGLTVAARAAAAAEAAGARTLPHVFAATHARLSSVGTAKVEALESIPAYVGSDPIDKLLMDGRASTGPLRFDWDRVRRHSVECWSETFTKERSS